MAQLVLLIGGNQGRRQELIQRAIDLIRQRIGSVAALSSLYETEPWGFEAEQVFLNQALIVRTNLTPEQALQRALQIEQDLGRERSALPSTGDKSYASRPMDIDIILWDNEVIDTPDLQVPHPRMQLRRFVLEPLCELMPEYLHPTLRKTLVQLSQTCPDQGIVKKL